MRPSSLGPPPPTPPPPGGGGGGLLFWAPRPAPPPPRAGPPPAGGRERRILFWVASRGHHADVGGTAPGSMTPRATTVDEEGVLIDNFKLVDGSVEGGHFREAELLRLLTEHPFPCRNPAQN